MLRPSWQQEAQQGELSDDPHGNQAQKQWYTRRCPQQHRRVVAASGSALCRLQRFGVGGGGLDGPRDPHGQRTRTGRRRSLFSSGGRRRCQNVVWADAVPAVQAAAQRADARVWPGGAAQCRCLGGQEKDQGCLHFQRRSAVLIVSAG